ILAAWRSMTGSWPALIEKPKVQYSEQKRKDFSCLLSPSQGYSWVISAPKEVSSPQRTQDTEIPLIPVKGKKGKKDKRDTCTIELTTQEKALLKDIWQYATSAVTEKYVRLCVSPRCGNECACQAPIEPLRTTVYPLRKQAFTIPNS
ncbi:MAG: hypothetical protein KAY65_06090, partial [Planctomycetes bacterium]|nr:hypothetical protein [Planctomycetota bacterium]